MIRKTNKPLISVIVPVYNTEKYLKKCLDSILTQTYKNLEVIIVNDGTKDNSENIIKEYLVNDDRVKYVRHSKNRGLFQARISGAEEAMGDYIAFVDSDDYISADWYRILVRKAMETDADMIIGNFYQECEDGRRSYFNLDPMRIPDLCLERDNILKAYMEQEGSFYSWQVIWNKLYKKALWDKGYQYFKEFSEKNPKLVMTEDIAFSSFFWANAQKVVNTQNTAYFYLERESASTGEITSDKLLKNFRDTVAVFDFFKQVLENSGRFSVYKKNYVNWRKLYGRINFNSFNKLGRLDKYGALLKKELFFEGDLSDKTFEDDFLYSIKTSVNKSFDWYGDIKRNIIDRNTKYVSFDIFDTLVCRPFWLPTDLFYFMNSDFMELSGASSDIDFAQIRIESEKLCREKIQLSHPEFDDIKLDEIYAVMEENYCISGEICTAMKAKEIEYELRFCRSRKTGAELYQLALDFGKKIIITSDMYLSKDVVEQILKKNGFRGYTKLYLSSELRMGKWSGKLYKYIITDLQTEADSILHIGDNWQSDMEMPRKYNIRSNHLDKASNIMANNNIGIYGGKIFSHAFINNPSQSDLNNGIWGFSGLRSMLAVVAEKFFDNPYVSINPETDFNADPAFIGYYALGMHIFAVAQWLADQMKNKKIGTLHFVARDGYIVQHAYDLLNKEGKLPESNYLYLSRKSLTFADVKKPVDLHSLINKLNIVNVSRKKFLDMFENMISQSDRDEFLSRLPEYEAVPMADNAKLSTYLETKFTNRREYEKFLNLFAEKMWDKISWDSYQTILKNYFASSISPNDAMFDIGYSGRSESAIKNILGYTINSFYIHDNSEILNRRMSQNHFTTELFYNHKPYITGVMREHMFMKMAPSTVGYKRKENGVVEPEFEEYSVACHTRYITSVVQNYAIKFVEDMIDIFGDKINEIYFRREDASQPFEYYLHYGKKLDRNIFATVIFEDDFGEGSIMRAVDFWSREIERTMKLHKNIRQENRIISENEYIGLDNPKKYDISGDDLHGRFIGKTTAIFMDKINEEDSLSDKYAKFAGNLNNVIEWEAAERVIVPQLIDSWYMTNPGGFSDGDFDIFLTMGLTEIRENTDLTYLGKVLNKIGTAPLLPITVGFSTNTEKSDFRLGAESVKVLCEIAERCKSIGVKGDFSAGVLKSFGINNIRIVGTPALYANISAKMDAHNTAEKISNISASFRPFYGVCSEKETKLLKYFADNSCRLVRATAFDLNESNIRDGMLLEELRQYTQTGVTYFTTKTWIEDFDNTDFAMGMNFYNNAAALTAGVPALFVNYETTGREMCRFYGLPCVEVDQFDEEKPISYYYRLAVQSTFLEQIVRNFEEYRSYLAENGIAANVFENKIIEK